MTGSDTVETFVGPDTLMESTLSGRPLGVSGLGALARCLAGAAPVPGARSRSTTRRNPCLPVDGGDGSRERHGHPDALTRGGHRGRDAMQETYQGDADEKSRAWRGSFDGICHSAICCSQVECWPQAQTLECDPGRSWLILSPSLLVRARGRGLGVFEQSRGHPCRRRRSRRSRRCRCADGRCGARCGAADSERCC